MKKWLLMLTTSLVALGAPALADEKPAGADEYVGRVFEKLRAEWEMQARTLPLDNADLTFILNPDGTLALSQLESGSPKPFPAGDIGPETLAFLKQAAPFESFPASMRNGRMEFRFHFTQDSMRMDSVRLLPQPVYASTPVTPPTGNDTIASATTTSSGVAFMALADRPGRGAAARSLPDLSQRPQGQSPPTQVMGVLGMAQPPGWPSSGLNAPGQGVAGLSPSNAGLSPLNMEDYVADVQERIRRNVQLPDSYLENLPATFRPVVAQVLIDRNGGLLSVMLTQPSGDKTLDEAVLRAIRQAAPYAPVPATAKSLPVEIETTFDPIPFTPTVAEGQ